MILEWAPQEVKTGVDRGVLYLGDEAFPWNGLVDVTEHAADDIIQTELYYDGNRFGISQTPDDFTLGVSSWAYPPEFEPYEGVPSQDEGLLTPKQLRRTFGFSYREGNLLHLVWNITATPTENVHSSRNNEFELTQFTWEFGTVKIPIENAAPAAHMVIDLDLAVPDAVAELLDFLYGTPSGDPSWLSPQDVLDIFATYPILIVTDNGDGTATITGPDEAVFSTGPDTATVTWPSVIYKSPILANIRSM